MKPIVFAGTASLNLAKKIIAQENYLAGSKKNIYFGNSEQKVAIESEVNEKDCLIIQSTSNPTDKNLFELILTIDALERSGAEKISCFFPYFGYARQNIQHLKNECVSMSVVIKILESFKVSAVITVDLHEEGSAGMFPMPFVNLSALPLLGKTIYENLKINPEIENQYVICSPDQGGVERARLFGNNFYQKLTNYEIVMTEKKRNLENIHDSKAVELYGDVKGKKVILVDDIITGGGTIINSAELCLQKGALEVFAAVVHPDFAPAAAAKIENSKLKNLWTTNTIEKTVDDLQKFEKINIVDIAEIF